MYHTPYLSSYPPHPPPPPPSVSFNVASSIYLYHLLPTSSTGMVRCPPVLCLHPPPTILHRSSLHPAIHACFCFHFLCPFAPPCRPRPVPRSLSVPVGSFIVGTSVLFMSQPLSLPVSFSVSCHLLVFVFCFCDLFRVQSLGAQAPPLSGSCLSQSSPSLGICPFRRSSGYPDPPPPPSLSPHIVKAFLRTKYLVAALLLEVDEQQHSNILYNLENDYMKGEQIYAKDVLEELKYLANYQGDRKISNSAQRSCTSQTW